MTSPSAEIPLPRRPEPRQPPSFPLVAVLAPVAASLAIWAMTRSAYSLLFAALGPLVAVGSLLDARIQGRRQARRERARFAADVDLTHRRIAEEKLRVRERLDRSVRPAAELMSAPGHDPERWRHQGGPLLVTLGRGAVVSGIRVTATPAQAATGVRGAGDDALETEVDAAVARLRDAAATVDDAPVIVDARDGIGVCGPPGVAAALARGLIVQLAAALSPADVELLVGAGGEPWLLTLPHCRGGSAAASLVEFIGSGRVVLVVADRLEDLPRECRLVLGVSGGEVVVLRHPPLPGATGTPPRSIRARFVSRLEAADFATTLAAAARDEGLGPGAAEPPGEVRLAGLAEPVGHADTAGLRRAPRAPGSLRATFAVDASSPVPIDLVADGPHAVIGGTTGSGKSELLISWVLALAAEHPPQSVTFLLVDFKGGSTFAAVERLPHCVGLITDLDRSSARRALESLRAELRHRERRLAGAGARSIDELAGPAESAPEALPRLVIIVDEFAAMIGDFPELHAVFADIAARGRSLGVHLILCTQRPAAVLRDSIMANCALRLSLRVSNAADSVAVIGTPDAATLPARPLGRCFLSVAGGRPRMLQVALSDPADADRVAGARGGTSAPRRPWLQPLPAVLRFDRLSRYAGGAAGEVPFGLLDLPEEQRQPVCSWGVGDGNLLILGGRGSGKTATLATLARSAGETAAMVLPPDLEGCWDALESLSGGAERGGAFASGAAPGAALVLIDDVDALVARFPETHQHLVTERLAGLLRDAPGRGIRVAMTAQRLTAPVHSLAALCDARLLLRLPTRQDHVMAGGDGTDHDAGLGPGGGWWRGHRVQVAWVPPAERPGGGGPPGARPPTRRAFEAGDFCGAVVTTRPHAFAAAFRLASPLTAVTTPGQAAETGQQGQRAHGGLSAGQSGAVVAVADPQGWQAQWGVLAALRSRYPVLFDRCTAAEFRAVSGSSAVPPPLARDPGGAWLLDPDGRLERVQLPRDLS